VPFDAPFDYLDYGDELGSSPVRWALIGGMDEILGWARSVGAHGSITTDGDLLVFIADRPASNAAALLATLRGTRR
jgi:hypothetical protein